MRIAAVDDDPLQLEFYARVLDTQGHGFHGFASGAELRRQWRRETFDLLIVDWQLPDASGPALVAEFRAQFGAAMPILFITHRDSEADIVQGLAQGADDYMTKPVRVGELVARVTALLRRAWPAPAEETLDFGRYRFLAAQRALEMDGVRLELTGREYDLALLLFSNLGRLLSRDHLREAVWGHSAEVVSRTLDTHISRLRQLLDLHPASGLVITAVYGIGYRLENVAAGAT
ncbi:response regulator transcription factor [Comamonas badia]|uniref:response regulator transcription factor n=1 Tax=Comamonas badia TaxID=265291 RepID=UPI00040CA4C2|nr:response regulator transcription factor [Comamonas badia]